MLFLLGSISLLTEKSPYFLFALFSLALLGESGFTVISAAIKKSQISSAQTCSHPVQLQVVFSVTAACVIITLNQDPAA